MSIQYKRKCKKNGYSGFTIIELLVTILILGILAAVAAPSFSDFVERKRVEAGTDDIVKTLSAARVEAMTITARSVFVCWNATAANITVNTNVITPGELVVMEGVAPFPLISSVTLFEGNIVVTDNETVDDCIGFDFQGRMTELDTGAGGAPVLFFLFCREAGDNTDAMRVEVSPSGRPSKKLNTNATGLLGVQAC